MTNKTEKPAVLFHPIPLEEKYDEPLAKLIRASLKEHDLALPGTVYYDPWLDHLTQWYGNQNGEYYVLVDENDELLGGVGFAPFPLLGQCAELQKLYLSEKAKHKGLGRRLCAFIAERAKELGYQSMYIETHHNLQKAIGLYESLGYQKIDPPKSVSHELMDHFYMLDF